MRSDVREDLTTTKTPPVGTIIPVCSVQVMNISSSVSRGLPSQGLGTTFVLDLCRLRWRA